MNALIVLVQLVISILLIASILLQGRGAGLGTSFGGGGEFYTARRGFERVLFLGTIVLIVVFLLSSLISVIIV